MRWSLAGVALQLAAARGMRAQGTVPAVPCAGQRIDGVAVQSLAPTAAAFRKVPYLAEIVSTIHVTTDPELIRRFVLLGEGDRCDELRRAESERILRAQPFIASASVVAVPDSSGGVELEVRTTDELSLVFTGSVSSSSPTVRFLRLGDANVAGQGVYMAGDWRAGGPYRTGFGGRFVDNQLLGQPYTLTAEAHRNPLGAEWQTDVAYPYYTDIQRLAWSVRAGETRNYVLFRNDANSSHALYDVRNYFDAGGIARVGSPGRLALFGASLSGDGESPGMQQVLVTDHGFATDTSAELLGRYETHRIARINALMGVRDIGFRRVRGYDALTATQDMPVGLQLGTIVGRSLAVLGSRDHDVFTAGDLYVGAVGYDNALRVQVEGEARYSNDDGEWDGILTTARAVEYYKPSNYNTLTASLEFSGGWRQRLPFALTLGDRDGGVRGFASSNTPGGQRLVARLEDRLFTGQPFNLGDMGVALFADAGRLWAGDIPYGVRTPVRKAVGVSLLATVPAGSARLWRIDFAVAANPETPGRRFELRMSSQDKTTFFLPEPNDIEATRERTVPSSIFRWPR
jgi:hypothetical protein